ncbi:hypothetical protein [Cellulomonas cellasea]|uniref:Uncharacterized protein n=1 Tax=Cellulomonas cellasea TaxID=43670 RepID=A0A7W4UGD6_9CELL|nr:hypothetical protein [Cellulomonas cellasea]MBB2923088.1 hypothetical protein [Cellulomonas cellasea]
MTDERAPARRQDIYDTARGVESLVGNLTFEQAYALTRLVLEHSGGPVPRKGVKAPIQPKTSAVLERRGLVERGGDQEGHRLRVQSVLDFGHDGDRWTATAHVADHGRVAAVIRASDEGIDLVGRARRLARGTSTHDQLEPPSLSGSGPVREPLRAFDADGGVVEPPLEYVVEAVVCQFGADGSPAVQEQSFAVAICVDVPDCDTERCKNAARFDMPVATRRGTGWANLCAAHAREAGLELLGAGRGSYLLHTDEIRREPVRTALDELGLLGALVLDEDVEEAAWSRLYRGLGFVRASADELVRRSGTVTVVARHLGAGRVGIDLRDARTHREPGAPPSFHAVVPDRWGEDLVRQVLVGVVGWRAMRPAGWEDLHMPLVEAVDVVVRGLQGGDLRTRLREFLGEPERFALSTVIDSPFQRASHVVVEQSDDWDLLAQVYRLHPDAGIRAAVLSRQNCPLGLLLDAATDATQRGTLLSRATLPDEVVELLFTRLATSSTAAEGPGRMLRAATHPLAPVAMVEAFLERALAERDDRLVVLDHAERLDPERQAVLRAAVLRRTHRGRTQDEVMTRLLGDQGVLNQPVVDWVRGLDHRASRARASAWIAARLETTRAELEDEFERRRDEATALASTSEVGADGRFTVLTSNYEAFRHAVSEAKRLRDLLATLPAPLSP